MVNSFFTRFRQWRRQKLTLRLRLALWSVIAILAISLLLALFINLAASITTSQSQRDLALPYATPIVATPDDQTQPSFADHRPFVAPIATEYVGGRISPREIAYVQENLLNQVRWISLVGLALVSVLGGLAAYWIMGLALRPVRSVSRAAQQISVKTLNRRLAIDAPKDELKELADAFDSMLNRLEQSFEQQSNFVGDASHELRTPLSTLRMNLEVIQSDPDATVDDYREMAETFERSLSRLERLVDDLLLLAQGESGIHFEEVALGELIEELLSDLTPLAKENNVFLLFAGESEVTVRGDGILLRRAISNLIENGIHYNRPGGNIRIDLEQREKWVNLRVADTGSGIPRENLDRIFDRFFRGDPSRSRRKGGAGLGLSIAFHIIQLHGGQIQVESEPGFGSTFTVILPL